MDRSICEYCDLTDEGILKREDRINAERAAELIKSASAWHARGILISP
jgi:hypothetical protein